MDGLRLRVDPGDDAHRKQHVLAEDPHAGVHDDVGSAHKAHDALEQRLGRRPTDQELAQCLGITPEELDEGLRAANGYVAGSLDAPVGLEADGSPRQWPLGAEEEAYDRIECLETLKPLLATLSDRDRLILSLRFGQELNQSEIGDRLGLSQMHVSRLLSRIMARLRAGMLGEGEGDSDGVGDPVGAAGPDRTARPDTDAVALRTTRAGADP